LLARQWFWWRFFTGTVLVHIHSFTLWLFYSCSTNPETENLLNIQRVLKGTVSRDGCFFKV
jgi:hypothetical protein